MKNICMLRLSTTLVLSAALLLAAPAESYAAKIRKNRQPAISAEQSAQAEQDSSTGPSFQKGTETGNAEPVKDGAAANAAATDTVSTETAAADSKTEVSLGIFCTSGYSNPHGERSADGSAPQVGHTVSTDWSVIPAGSKIRLANSELLYTVEDRGVHGNWVDVYYSTEAEAETHGLQYLEVFLIR